MGGYINIAKHQEFTKRGNNKSMLALSVIKSEDRSAGETTLGAGYGTRNSIHV